MHRADGSLRCRYGGFGAANGGGARQAIAAASSESLAIPASAERASTTDPRAAERVPERRLWRREARVVRLDD